MMSRTDWSMFADRTDGRRRTHREAFARFLRAKELRAQGMTQKDIARVMGVHPVTVWTWWDRYDGMEGPLA